MLWLQKIILKNGSYSAASSSFSSGQKVKQLFLKTGFTGVNFSGKSVQIAAGRRDRFETWNRTKQAPLVFFCRWVDFAKFNSSSPIHDLHESILSYQCVCRTENTISWNLALLWEQGRLGPFLLFKAICKYMSQWMLLCLNRFWL